MTKSAARQLEGSILATVSTAEAVLTHFERSLIDAGFAEGAESYTRLADTLIGQRLWAESSGTASRAPFSAVAARARAIHALLLPYVEAFGRLSVLASPSLLGGPERAGNASPATDPAALGTSATDPAAGRAAGEGGTGPDDDPLATAVLAALDAAGRPLSLTALRAVLKVPPPELLAAVERLAVAGRVERRTASGRELVSRSERR